MPVGPFSMPIFIVASGVDDDIVLEAVQAGFVAGLCAAGTNLVYRRYEWAETRLAGRRRISDFYRG